jgi:hypothetical protein
VMVSSARHAENGEQQDPADQAFQRITPSHVPVSVRDAVVRVKPRPRFVAKLRWTFSRLDRRGVS